MSRTSTSVPETMFGPQVTSERLFSGLSMEAVRDLATIEIAHSYVRGAVLFQEGEPADGIFVVKSGSVRLSICSSRGERMVLRLAGAGEVLGLSATMAGTAHEVTAETTVSSQLVFIKRKDFVRYLREHRDACLQVVELLSNDVHAAYDRVRVLGLARIRHNHN